MNSDDKASVWQNKRTGLFEFMGEHNGKPVYQNNVTKEFLFFTFTGSEWLVGPDFRKPHAGIQVSSFNNPDSFCSEFKIEILKRFLEMKILPVQNEVEAKIFHVCTLTPLSHLLVAQESGPKMTPCPLSVMDPPIKL